VAGLTSDPLGRGVVEMGTASRTQVVRIERVHARRLWGRETRASTTRAYDDLTIRTRVSASGCESFLHTCSIPATDSRKHHEIPDWISTMSVVRPCQGFEFTSTESTEVRAETSGFAVGTATNGPDLASIYNR
jgi:hypothetical protein